MKHVQAASTLQHWLSLQSDYIKNINGILSELNAVARVNLEELDTHKLESLIHEITHRIDSIAQHETPIAELMKKISHGMSDELKNQYISNQDAIEDFILEYNNFIQYMEQKKDILKSKIGYAESFISQL